MPFPGGIRFIFLLTESLKKKKEIQRWSRLQPLPGQQNQPQKSDTQRKVFILSQLL
jgi:hypothetical protein